MTLRVVTDVHTQHTRDGEIWEMLDRTPDRYDKSGVLTAEGRPRPTRSNLKLVFDFEPFFEDGFKLNLFSDDCEYMGEHVQDHHEVEVATFLSEVYALDANTNLVREVMQLTCRANPYHPIREYIESTPWDGIERLETWLQIYVGAVDSTLTRNIGVRWMISAVARLYAPGCKVDTVLILVGPQGAKKSTVFRILAGESWFTDSPVDLKNKDAMQVLRGNWIFEWAELENLKRSQNSTAKAFVTSQVDVFRPSHARNFVRWKRQTVLVGTTNEPEFLSDATGARRYWPIKVSAIDADGLRGARDQLWAEALVRYQDDQAWWLPSEVEALLAAEAEQYASSDPWMPLTVDFLSGRSWASVREILTKAVKMETAQQNRSSQMRVAGILGECGWIKGPRRRFGGKLQVPWYPPGSTPP